MEPMGVGIIGCGNISDRYFDAGETFAALDIVGCTDLEPERAEAKSETYGVEAFEDVEALVRANEVDIAINLTPPRAHAEVSLEIIDAGTHVYSEKPLAATPSEASDVLDLAAKRDVRIGCAPDTVLGRGIQTARRALDEGRIGDPIGATAFFTSGGHESWHPDPDGFYLRGGGPLLDMGPYYVTALAHLLGPATRIAGSTRQPFPTRTIASEPRAGEPIDVEVPTHEIGVVDYEIGATATLIFSFDVPDSRIAPQNGLEIHGSEGTLLVPDPNHFDGEVRVSGEDEATWETIPLVDGPAGQQRGLGVVDLAEAIRGEWDHRTSGEVAYHVLEIMAGVRRASEMAEYVTPTKQIERPEPMPASF